MPYEKDRPKTKRVIFRINKNGYDFLKLMSEITGFDISELLRKIVLLYYMDYFMNEKPYMSLSERYEVTKKRFLELFTDDFLKGVAK